MMAATLNRDRHTASGVTDAQHFPAAAEKYTRTGKGVHPETTLMRSPDGKSQRGDDGGKCIGIRGNDEDTYAKIISLLMLGSIIMTL